MFASEKEYIGVRLAIHTFNFTAVADADSKLELVKVLINTNGSCVWVEDGTKTDHSEL